MKSKMLCGILLLLGALSFSACGTFEVPDLEFCSTLSGNAGGFCKTTLSNRETEIPNPYWKTCQPEADTPCLLKMIHITPENVGKALKFIEKVCDKSQKCIQEEIDQGEKILNELMEAMDEQTPSFHH